MLASYEYQNADPMSAMVDVKDGEGHTVLQAAIEAEWVPGVCVALEAGADVALKVSWVLRLYLWLYTCKQ